MSSLNTILPFTSFIVSLSVAFFIFRRFVKRKGLHLLLWGIGMVFYSLGGFCEAFYGLFGWNAIIFRLWYLFGAILVAAWLGQGTVYLLAKPRLAHILMAILFLGSLFAAYRIFTAELDPTLMTKSVHTGSELSGQAIVTSGVRSLTPFFNLYGTVTLVGGAAWSAFIFWRKRVLLHRVIGNVLIAFGAILPAFGGALSRFGIANALYWSELLGAVFILLGFLRATKPMAESLLVQNKETKENMICPSCGKETPDNSAFCLHCGVKISSPNVAPAQAASKEGRIQTNKRSPIYYGASGFALGFIIMVCFVTAITLTGPSYPISGQTFSTIQNVGSWVLPIGLGVLGYYYGKRKQ